MYKWIEQLTQHCVRSGIIKETDMPWFRYGIERRLVTICAAVPFFIIAILLVGFSTAFSFFFSFFLLRTKTNGYHSKTLVGCIAISLLVELLLCASFSCITHPLLLVIPCATSHLVIYILAPFVHPNLPLSNDAIARCRQQARQRSTIILAVTVLAVIFNLTHVSKGMTMGITMASSMLCFPYIKRKVILTWRNLTKKSKKSQLKWQRQ